MILIVEDEAVARRALRALLSASGFEVVAVGSAEEALRVIDQGNVPDVALVDLNLPGMNGIELISRFERAHPHIRAVLITAALPEYLHDMRDDAHIEYMRKPINVNSLVESLSRSTTHPA